MTMSNLSVLVVDDQPEILTITEYALSKAGYDVATAYNARRALRLVRQRHFDLILTDLAMPDIGGDELIKDLRELPHTNGTRILAVTAHQGSSIAAAAVANGCDGVILKPFTGSQLRERIAQYVEKWGLVPRSAGEREAR